MTKEQTPEEKKAARKAEQAANFKRLAASRVEKALAAIEMIGGCANKNNYVYTPEQVEKIGKALEQSVIKTMGRFAADAVEEAPGFEL